MRRIAVVTGNRADYGLLRVLMKEIRADPALDLLVVATGGHPSRDLRADGISAVATVDSGLVGDSPADVARALGRVTAGFAECLERLRPDLVVLLGDRFEALASAQAALLARVPVAHLHGGESSAGVVDESIRHAITKLSHLHFVSAEPYRRRVLQLGEPPDRVWTVGLTAADNIADTSLAGWPELESVTGLRKSSPFFVVTFHPVTLDPEAGQRGVRALVAALEEFPEAALLLTGANPDPGREAVSAVMAGFCARHPRARFVESLGSRLYLSAIALCDAVVGNSSSGLVEAPLLGVPSVNVGSRQDGRLRCDSVVDCPDDAGAIAAALREVTGAGFRERAAGQSLPFPRGSASLRIKTHLKSVGLGDLLVKRFHEIPWGGTV